LAAHTLFAALYLRLHPLRAPICSILHTFPEFFQAAL
jgi:hypothetical protein